MTGVKLAKISGVDDSKISRYLSGDQQWVSPDHLEKLTKAISDDPHEQAELIRAHLYDECIGHGAELIDIRIGREVAQMRDVGPTYKTPLPAEAEEDFSTLRAWYIKDKNVREMIQGMANLLRTGDARTREEQGKHLEHTEVIHEPENKTPPHQKRRPAGLSRSEQQ